MQKRIMPPGAGFGAGHCKAGFPTGLSLALILLALALLPSCSEPDKTTGGFASGSLQAPTRLPDSSSGSEAGSEAGTAAGSQEQADPAAGGSGGNEASADRPEPRWQLVWADEFDYTGLPDPARWGYDTGGHGWGNQELQNYTSEGNAWVENGLLVIEARNEPSGGREYSSARLVTRGKGDWLYGRIEVRARLPEGLGTWPAIWMLPTDWNYGTWPASGEIDIMEHVGYDPGVVHGTVHTSRFNHLKGTHQGASLNLENPMANFHVYSIDWYEDRILFYIDGREYFRFSPFVQRPDPGFEEWPFDQRFHLLLNIAVGGTWGGSRGVDPEAFPVRMQVDYVRVYEDVSGN